MGESARQHITHDNVASMSAGVPWADEGEPGEGSTKWLVWGVRTWTSVSSCARRGDQLLTWISLLLGSETTRDVV